MDKLFSEIKGTSLKDVSKHLRKSSTDPYIDWAIILVIWFILFIIFSIIAYLICGQATSETAAVIKGNLETTTKTFDVQKLDDVLKEMNSRRAEWIRLKDDNYSFPEDPSL